MGNHEGNHEAGRMFGDLEKVRDPVRTVVRNVGEVLITLGLIVLLFVVYELYITNLFSAGEQREATAALDDEWKQKDTVNNDAERTAKYDLKEGEGFAKLYIPKFGEDYHFTILEGTTDKILERGPGHYKGTALPGQPGNFSVAGHRVGKGAPFNDLDLLESCDAIIVETKSDWFVYRMLPKKEEIKTWSTAKGTSQRCEKVKPPVDPAAKDGGPYGDTFGQEIVAPSKSGVIAPVPNRPGVTVPTAQQASLLTLTTCHPRFSDRQRLIVHAVMTQHWAKDPKKPGVLPPELKETV